MKMKFEFVIFDYQFTFEFKIDKNIPPIVLNEWKKEIETPITIEERIESLNPIRTLKKKQKSEEIPNLVFTEKTL
jgi:hypothetical protein